jgi:reactive intermediate/imine deaminase
MREIIQTPDAPGSALFSQAIKTGSTIYVSGTTGIDPKTNRFAGTTIQAQTRQALLNCEAILRAAGAKLADVVEVGILLAKAEDFAGLNEAYATFFPADPPARSVSKIGVDLPELLVSIKMIAILTS